MKTKLLSRDFPVHSHRIPGMLALVVDNLRGFWCDSTSIRDESGGSFDKPLIAFFDTFNSISFPNVVAHWNVVLWMKHERYPRPVDNVLGKSFSARKWETLCSVFRYQSNGIGSAERREKRESWKNFLLAEIFRNIFRCSLHSMEGFRCSRTWILVSGLFSVQTDWVLCAVKEGWKALSKPGSCQVVFKNSERASV